MLHALPFFKFDEEQELLPLAFSLRVKEFELG